MDCLLALCIYITGGLGPQQGYRINDNGDSTPTETITNGYGMFIGDLGISIEKNGFYSEARHISGINTAENDLGMNNIMFGVSHRVKNNMFRFGFGLNSNFNPDVSSNSYGSTVVEMSGTHWFGDGMFVKVAKIDSMVYAIVGLSADIF